jgi:four helix bundle protein
VRANIVEGFARYSPRERAQFLRIALSSLAELSYCMHVARRLDYITVEVTKEIDLALRSVEAPLRGLVRPKSPTTP